MGAVRSSEGVLELRRPRAGLARRPADPVQRRPRRIDGAVGQLLPAIALLIVSPLAIGATLLAAGERSEHVAVIAPFWYDARTTMELVGRAGGRIVDVAGFDMAGFGSTVVAIRGEGETRQGFLDALRREGAWLTLDAGAVRGCIMR